MRRSIKFLRIFFASLLLIGGSFNLFVANLFFSNLDHVKIILALLRIKKAVYSRLFNIFT
jgi:hypothetical protein